MRAGELVRVKTGFTQSGAVLVIPMTDRLCVWTEAVGGDTVILLEDMSNVGSYIGVYHPTHGPVSIIGASLEPIC